MENFNPDNLSRQFPIAVVEPGLPRMTFHTLRHPHALPEMQEEAAELVDNALRAALNNGSQTT
ncbi:MAG: hypothetical protein HQ513_17380 [Rhodospirillales bacterium]|nr:hypothetical protein [Rhodospirillales bacterium]